MDDLIRKQDAIDAIQDEISKESHRPHQITLLHAKRRIENLLPAQQWIPVSDRLPKGGQVVLITTSARQVIQCEYEGFKNGHHVWRSYGGMYVFWDYEVLAWYEQRLPEPYEEEQDE